MICIANVLCHYNIFVHTYVESGVFVQYINVPALMPYLVLTFHWLNCQLVALLCNV